MINDNQIYRYIMIYSYILIDFLILTSGIGEWNPVEPICGTICTRSLAMLLRRFGCEGRAVLCSAGFVNVLLQFL